MIKLTKSDTDSLLVTSNHMLEEQLKSSASKKIIRYKKSIQDYEVGMKKCEEAIDEIIQELQNGTYQFDDMDRR